MPSAVATRGDDAGAGTDDRTRQLAALRSTYPGYRIIHYVRRDGADGGWWAFRNDSPNEQQRLKGVYACVARSDAVSLGTALAEADALLQLTNEFLKPPIRPGPA
ncbi:hypothetical protein ACGFIV_24520 [Sphaerisporangium sp. NPDC049003]|uniref:hypothetical protein n=1 Tax=Sphaerisporangium sp. NPDC049003 TaxID=3364517 RepID=UPI00371F076E